MGDRLATKFNDSTPVLYSLKYLLWNRLSTINFFSKNRLHRILELELEQTNNDCAMFYNEITITIINMGRKFRGRAGYASNTKSPGL